jgi:hypothetical protein
MVISPMPATTLQYQQRPMDNQPSALMAPNSGQYELVPPPPGVRYFSSVYHLKAADHDRDWYFTDWRLTLILVRMAIGERPRFITKLLPDTTPTSHMGSNTLNHLKSVTSLNIRSALLRR